MDEEFWKTEQPRQKSGQGFGRTGALNIALLFGTAAIALSLIITPMLARRSDDDRKLASVKQDFDMITTGSIKSTTDNTTRRYTIRRSITQDNGPGSVCVVQGYASGDDC